MITFCSSCHHLQTTNTQSYITPVYDTFPWFDFTDFDIITEHRFPKGICNGCGMPTGDANSSGHLVLSHFGTCMCSNVETNLSWTCLVSGLLNFEHPSVLLFCPSIADSGYILVYQNHRHLSWYPSYFEKIIAVDLKKYYHIFYSVHLSTSKHSFPLNMILQCSHSTDNIKSIFVLKCPLSSCLLHLSAQVAKTKKWNLRQNAKTKFHFFVCSLCRVLHVAKTKARRGGTKVASWTVDRKTRVRFPALWWQGG